MRLLYKKQNEHDKQFPKKYRPIALLNLDYKILSKILANQLNTVMSHLLSQSQYCQKGKYIGDLIHLIQSIIFDVNTPSHQKGFIWMSWVYLSTPHLPRRTRVVATHLGRTEHMIY